MTGKRKPYKTYTKEFKLEAVRLMRESGRPASECPWPLLAPSPATVSLLLLISCLGLIDIL